MRVAGDGRRSAWGWAALLIAPVLPAAAAPMNVGPLAWSDEFDGAALDPTRWAVNEPGVWGDMVNTADAARVAGGALTITTYTDPADGTHYSAVVGTQDHFLTTYGYFEARIRFSSSPGMWSAFYLNSPTFGDPVGNPAAAGTEVGVVEHRATDDDGRDVTDRYLSAVHWDGYGEDHRFIARTILPGEGRFGGAWHTYGVHWAPDGYTFYFDDRPVWSTPGPVSRRPQYLLLSSEVQDGSWAGVIPAEGYGPRELSTTTMEVDAVRVYHTFSGDANLDSLVDPADLAVLDAHWGTESGAAWGDGDFNGDGAVDVLDLDILAGYFGSGGGCDPTAFFEALAAYPRMHADFVPEPGMAGLVALAGLTRVGWRRRRPRAV